MGRIEAVNIGKLLLCDTARGEPASNCVNRFGGVLRVPVELPRLPVVGSGIQHVLVVGAELQMFNSNASLVAPPIVNN